MRKRGSSAEGIVEAVPEGGAMPLNGTCMSSKVKTNLLKCLTPAVKCVQVLPQSIQKAEYLC